MSTGPRVSTGSAPTARTFGTPSPHPLCREFYGKGECEELRTWIEKPGLELRDTVQRLIQRQHWLELSSGGTAAGVFKRLSGVLRQEALDAVGSPHYNGSTAPDGLGWYFVPYHFSSEPSRSGYMLGYRFEQPGSSLLALNANVAPWVRAPVEGERRFFLALDAGISLRPRFAWLSKLDVNALYRANFVQEDFVNALGPALTSYWFYDKLRLQAMVFPG